MIQKTTNKIIEYIYSFNEAVSRLTSILNEPSEVKQLEGIKFILEIARQDQEHGESCMKFFQSLITSGLTDYLIVNITRTSSKNLAILSAELLSELSSIIILKLQDFFVQHLNLIEQLINYLSTTKHDEIGYSIFTCLLALMTITDKTSCSSLWDFTIVRLIKRLEVEFYYQYKPFCLELLIAVVPVHTKRLWLIMMKEKLLSKVGLMLMHGPKNVKLSALRFVKAVVMKNELASELIRTSHVFRIMMEMISRIRKHGMILETFRAILKVLIDRNETQLLESLVREGKGVSVNFELLPELKIIWSKHSTEKKSIAGKRLVHEGVIANNLFDRGIEELRREGHKRMKIISETSI